MKKSNGRAANQLLADLSRSDYRNVSPHLKSITLVFADVLTERNALVSHVYFPTSGLIALHTATIGRPSLAMVGSEGMVGASVAAGIATSEALIVVKAKAPRCACTPAGSGCY